ncbi:hypothetical protein JCM11641_006406 [Rhodosporidiobolus odoratus]
MTHSHHCTCNYEPTQSSDNRQFSQLERVNLLLTPLSQLGGNESSTQSTQSHKMTHFHGHNTHQYGNIEEGLVAELIEGRFGDKEGKGGRFGEKVCQTCGGGYGGENEQEKKEIALLAVRMLQQNGGGGKNQYHDRCAHVHSGGGNKVFVQICEAPQARPECLLIQFDTAPSSRIIKVFEVGGIGRAYDNCYRGGYKL